MQKSVLVCVGVAVIVLGGIWVLNMQKETPVPATNSETKEVSSAKKSVAIKLSERTLSPNMVTVTQGDAVTIQVTSDEAGEFHVSGYEIENDMTAKAPLEFTFVADRAGRYNFELHPKAETGEADSHEENEIKEEHASDSIGSIEEDIVIGAFVVSPK